MKVFLYMIVAVLFVSILITPIVEVFCLGRDRVLLSSTMYNSFRAARESSYSYLHMREIDAVADEEAFLRSFADTFEVSYGMHCISPPSNPLRFASMDGDYNDFEVYVDFRDEAAAGDAIATVVTITAKSEYRFRTMYMRMLSFGETNPYLLLRTQTYTMKVTN